LQIERASELPFNKSVYSMNVKYPFSALFLHVKSMCQLLSINVII